jgi:HK97 family phage prohead protease
MAKKAAQQSTFFDRGTGGPLSSYERNLQEVTDEDLEKFDGIIRREVAIEVKAINEEERSFEVIASTDTIDSHGDVVEQTFDLKRYKKNPVVLWLHNSFGWLDGSRAEDYLPIGRAENVKVVDGKLEAKIFIVSGDGEQSLSEKIWRRVKQRVLRAVSIGFRPGLVSEEKDSHGHYFYRLSDNELYEISVVPIPSNPDAVAKSVALQHKHLSRLAAKNTTKDSDIMADNDAFEKSLREKAEAEAEVKTLREKLEASQKETKSAADKAADLEQKLAAEQEKRAELAEKLKEQEVELKKFRDATAADEQKACEADVEAALKAKYAPAKHEEKRKMLMKFRQRGADELKEFLADIPDLKETQTVIKSNGTDDKSGSEDALIAKCSAD